MYSQKSPLSNFEKVLKYLHCWFYLFKNYSSELQNFIKSRLHFKCLLCVFSRLKRIKLYEYHCVKNVRIRSYSGPYFPAFGLNAERNGVFLRIQSEFEKIRTRLTPNTDMFHAVYPFWLILCCEELYYRVNYIRKQSFIWSEMETPEQCKEPVLNNNKDTRTLPLTSL